jgi:chemotaxis protein methyltransferase CheR
MSETINSLNNLHPLAEVPDTPELLRDYDRFRTLILDQAGLDLRQYKFEQTYRRIWAMVERARLRCFTDYFHAHLREGQQVREFIDRLAINVSEMFRNPDRFGVLQKCILPELLQRSHHLSVWSAGCSNGAEAYSLAILLHELAPDRRHMVLGTDIDQTALRQANEGVFEEADIRHVPGECLANYFRAYRSDEKVLYEAAPFLQQYLTFQAHDLLKDPYPEGLDLIACRNVVIYFSEGAKEQVFHRLQTALKPGGYLFVGNSERIFNSHELGLVRTENLFYRKQG